MTSVATERSLTSRRSRLVGLEDALPLDEPLLNLRVARQRTGARPHTETLGGLPLRQREVLDAVLDHEASRLFGELMPQVGRSHGEDRRRPLIAASLRKSARRRARARSRVETIERRDETEFSSRSGKWSMSNFSKMVSQRAVAGDQAGRRD